VLFNGGFFASPLLRDRLLEVMGGWFAAGGKPWKPLVLENGRLDLAVARGAAHYGMVRRGHGARISGGLAQSYYIGVQTAGGAGDAICLLPAGVEEGQEVDHGDRRFALLIRQPVQFPLFVSSTRTTDKPGQMITIDPLQMTALPPIRTVLHSGRKAVADTVDVALHARRTEIGTLDLWCSEIAGDRTWRLRFDVRSATRPGMQRHAGDAERQGFIDQTVARQCDAMIRAAFTRGTGAADRPEGLVKRLEAATAMSRAQWPSSLLRGFWEVLMEMQEGRKLGEIHEARWLNLVGFSLRPGFGLAVDDWRVAQTWRLFGAKVIHDRDGICRAQWWVLWRRIAGGLTPGQQQTLAEPLIGALKRYLKARFEGKGGASASGFAQQELGEAWRVLGSLELLKQSTKLELGDMLLGFIERERAAAPREAALWALGRLGARVPVYGPLNALAPASAARAWIDALLSSPRPEKTEFTIVQLARRTGDRYRDLDDDTRQRIVGALAAGGASERSIQLVREGGELGEEEQQSVFGESLPSGLRLE
jgi:hypothetical protein